MTDEITQTQDIDVEQDYIKRITELKANSVPLEEYNKVREDNKRMLDTLINGSSSSITIKQEPVEVVDIQALRDELYGGRYDGTDLDYMTKTLKLRKALMDKGELDPAVGRGHKTEPTDYDYENCQATCDAIQECIDYAAGDPAVFRNELMRRTNKSR